MSFLDSAIDKYRQLATIKQDLRLSASAPMQNAGLNAVSQPQNTAAAGAQAVTTQQPQGVAAMMQNKTVLIAGGVAVAALVLLLVMRR